MASTGRRLTITARKLILRYKEEGLSHAKIKQVLRDRHLITTTKKSIYRILAHHRSTGTVKRKQPSSKNVKLTDLHRQVLHMWMQEKTESTSTALSLRFKEELGINVSQSHVRLIRRQMGWKTSQAKYCQLISAPNRRKRLEWALNALSSNEKFEDVIFMDETTVEMSSTGRVFSHETVGRLDCMANKQAKPKHAYKVHVWGGISYHGRTDICIFTGTMDSVIYQQILEKNLIPFAKRVFPNGYRLYQDNDSKHKSKSTKEWMSRNGIEKNFLEAPASSPDINPIENLWAALKRFLSCEVKPKKKDELVEGIRTFWESLTVDTCSSYIDHIHKVLPHVVLNNGHATKY